MTDTQQIFEEDIEVVTETVIRVLGPQGRMLPTGPTVQYNTILETKEYGKIWYGDVDVVADDDKLIRLSTNIPGTLLLSPSDIESRFPESELAMMHFAHSAYANGQRVKHRYL